MALTFLGIGEKAKVVGIKGKLKLRHYLTELGFTAGRNVEITQQSIGNNLIVALEGGRIALDRKIAHQINIVLE